MAKTEFIFEGGHYGAFHERINLVEIDLKAHQKRYGKNQSNMIKHIMFCINHEFIHVAQKKVKEISQTHKGKTNYPSERQIYYMIGNGRNKDFNPYYNIRKDHKWWNKRDKIHYEQ